MKHRYLALVVGSVWSISACGARTNEEEFLGYYGGVKPGSGGAPGSGGEAPGGAGGLGPGGGGSGGANVGGSGGFVNTGGRPGVGGNPSGGAGGSGGSPPINSCCEPHGEMGCNVPFVEECTCNLDSYCCEKMWDDRCVQVADRACLASCGAGSGGQGATGGQGGVGGLTSTGGASDPGNCCSAHDSPGCQNTDIQDCVCGGDTFDTFCCNTAWDDICTFEAETKCGALCSAQGSGGVAGSGGSPLSCDFAGDCGSCLCASCPGEIADCQGDAGCLAVTWCVQATMCLPFNCYEPDTCGALIDQFGGVNGSAATRALELSTCLLNAGCPCQ